MRLDYGIRLETTQKLVMTPQLRQAIAILQLSSLELGELVDKELLDNPVLEVEEKETQDTEQEHTDYEPNNNLNEYLEWDDYLSNGIDPGRNSAIEKKPIADNFVVNTVSLHEYLESQLHMAITNTTSRMIGHYLLGCIDDNGYLCCSTNAAALDLGVPEEHVQVLLELIQSFEPSGVGARDLKECLRLQVVQKGIKDSLILSIINGYLNEVGEGRYKYIADQLGCSRAEVQRVVDIIRTLDPKPGRAFGGSGGPGYVVPDITVQKIGKDYVILINDNQIPNLTINPFYRTIARTDEGEARKFIEQKINSAIWLIKSIEQRRRTLYNVMEAILELQRDFFEKGPKHLRPLTMKKVADHIGVHESTVSRATAGKYVDTPLGLFSLRVFFSASVHGADGEEVSASTAKKEIAEIVKKEEPTMPFSDQAISDFLAGKGIMVSRRTVTKYREELGIASSSKRKRYL